MNKKHICNTCNYSTDDMSNWLKHCGTKKHTQKMGISDNIDRPDKKRAVRKTSLKSDKNRLTKVNPVKPKRVGSHQEKISDIQKDQKPDVFICEYCAEVFDRSYNLYRHLTSCKNKDNAILNMEMDKLRKELEEANKLREADKREAERRISEIKQQVEEEKIRVAEEKKRVEEEKKNAEYFKSLITGAGSLLGKSLSNIAYLSIYHKDAPKLLAMDENAPINKMDDQALVDKLVYSYNKKMLAKYIGDHIVAYYKKENPKEQSFWTSDSLRLNYLIKETTKWKIDKKGVTVCDSVIRPLLSHIRSILEKHNETAHEYVMNHPDNLNKNIKLNRKVFIAMKIITLIKDDKLTDDINKYIAPRLHLQRDDVCSDTGMTDTNDDNTSDDSISMCRLNSEMSYNTDRDSTSVVMKN